MPLQLFEPRYVQMIEDALEGGCVFCVLDLEIKNEDAPLPSDIIATAGLVRMAQRTEDGIYQCLLQGLVRVQLKEWIHNDEALYPQARLEPLHDEPVLLEEVSELKAALEEATAPALENLPDIVRFSIDSMMTNIEDLGVLSDLITQQLVNDPAYRQELLNQPCVQTRIETLIEYLDLGV